MTIGYCSDTRTRDRTSGEAVIVKRRASGAAHAQAQPRTPAPSRLRILDALDNLSRATAIRAAVARASAVARANIAATPSIGYESLRNEQRRVTRGSFRSSCFPVQVGRDRNHETQQHAVLKEAGMPHIEHADLVAFADDKVNLKKDEIGDQRDQFDRLQDKIEAKISSTPGYGLVKTLHSGSVAKGTALRNNDDRDLAVYVEAEQAPDDTPGLVEWVRDRVVEAYPILGDDQIVPNTHSVTITFVASGLKVDIVPVLYKGEPDDVGYLINKDSDKPLRTSVRQHLDFIRDRKKVHPVHLAQLIRFTKWWARLQKKRDSDFKCKSFMIELLWVHRKQSEGFVTLGDTR
ncbi:CBASS oligonucleotide cyclase [Nonomuraea cavernae]|nr:CBASS oligonucleotide cyclase [Nonomuraea cavernae]MCA2187514.1 nucleotidyltransferase [Nonomuraea cavernae]